MDSKPHHACPDCGSIDVTMPAIYGANATCPICNWEGAAGATTGLLTSDRVFGIEEVGEILIRTVGRYSAGPVIQCLEVLGLSPKAATSDVAGWSELIDELRNEVLQAIVAATVEAALNAGASAHHRAKEFLVRRNFAEAVRVYPELVAKNG